MCCFSGHPSGGWLRRLFPAPSVQVANTQIFARREGAEQLLAYAMRLTTAAEVAMILPLPVRPGCGEDELHFIDLQGYPRLFADLARCWEAPLAAPIVRGLQSQARAAPLVVHEVGAFEASFVPTRADFARLDRRFRLADEVWDALPEYRDHGFAVFKLKPGTQLEVHPMAFRFPTREPERLFFPTVHVHDGRVHTLAHFDHTLYFQGRDGGVAAIMPITVSVSLGRTQGLVVDAELRRKHLGGELPNRDTWI